MTNESTKATYKLVIKWMVDKHNTNLRNWEETAHQPLHLLKAIPALLRGNGADAFGTQKAQKSTKKISVFPQ